MAYSLVHGVPKLKSFDDEAIRDERVRALARKISVAIDPEFADAHEDYPTRLTITLADGRTAGAMVVYASGTAKYPMTPAQMEEKFFDCAAQAVSTEAASKIYATLGALGEQKSFDGFWPLLSRG